MLFQMSVPIKNSWIEKCSSIYRVTFCFNILYCWFNILYSCREYHTRKTHVKSSRKLKKNVHIEDLQNYFFLCTMQVKLETTTVKYQVPTSCYFSGLSVLLKTAFAISQGVGQIFYLFRSVIENIKYTKITSYMVHLFYLLTERNWFRFYVVL